jgi:hypothetical protein
MMRPICLSLLILLMTPLLLVAQDPVATALRTTVWPGMVKVADGLGWSVFSRQYYCVSNWNASGVSVDYSHGKGQSTALLYRDGIPGFSWYHLYVSHFRQFDKISGMLQLRFSWMDIHNRPAVFRLGGNIRATWSMNQTMLLQVSIYDFTGWIVPEVPIARGDPSMQFVLCQQPGRLIGLATGFRLSRAQFGPVTTGIRMNISDQISLTGFLDILPVGISFGICWAVKGYSAKGWLDHHHGPGLTPLIQISHACGNSF